MTTDKSSFLLYDGYQEWLLPRDCLELGIWRYSPKVKISVGLDEHSMRWYTRCRSGKDEENKLAFQISIHTTNSSVFRRSVGVKCSLKIIDGTNNALLEHFKSYSQMRFMPEGIITNALWLIRLEKVLPYLGGTKIISTYQVCDPVTKPTGALKYGAQLVQELDNERKKGISTDIILKYGQTEYEAHKLILAVQSDFFKARFSDHWDDKKEKIVVDMNDSDLNPEILEALISSAYTGQVRSFEMAMKLLPVTDKYQFTKLKEVCEHEIGYHLTMDNVLELHQLASYCNAHILQRQCEFVKQ